MYTRCAKGTQTGTARKSSICVLEGLISRRRFSTKMRVSHSVYLQALLKAELLEGRLYNWEFPPPKKNPTFGGVNLMTSKGIINCISLRREQSREVLFACTPAASPPLPPLPEYPSTPVITRHPPRKALTVLPSCILVSVKWINIHAGVRMRSSMRLRFWTFCLRRFFIIIF